MPRKSKDHKYHEKKKKQAPWVYLAGFLRPKSLNNYNIKMFTEIIQYAQKQYVESGWYGTKTSKVRHYYISRINENLCRENVKIDVKLDTYLNKPYCKVCQLKAKNVDSVIGAMAINNIRCDEFSAFYDVVFQRERATA